MKKKKINLDWELIAIIPVLLLGLFLIIYMIITEF